MATSVLFAQKIGTIEAVRAKLADQSSCSSVLGTLNGKMVEGTRWLNMPRVSEPKNLVAFGGCPISGPPSTRPIRRTSTWGVRPGGRFR